MKYAFLIAAHKDVDQLFRLIKSLSLYGDLFIHIDKRTDDSFVTFLKNKIVSCLKTNSNQIVILDNRVNVTWAGYSQLYCQQNLISAALNTGIKYDRFFYLSGLDYPIFSKEELDSYCNQHKNMEFIKGFNISQSSDDYLKSRVCLYHFFRDINLPHKSFLRRFIIGGTKLLLKYLGIRRKPYIMIQNKRFDVYFSSQWTGLTYECIKFVYDNLINNKPLVEYFKSTYAPDELIIPTIIFNSTFRDNASVTDDSTFEELPVLHYLNMTDHVWEYCDEDYDTLIHSNKPFVRKLVSHKSEKLIELLEYRKINPK